MKKVYIYLRVSSEEQANGRSLERQEEVCCEYARIAGFEIAGIFRDVEGYETKYENERPAFFEMLGAILRKGVNVIIVESWDRLARENRIQETLSIYLASKEVDLISAVTGENATRAIQRDPLKKTLIRFQRIFADMEKNQIVGRLKKGRERKKLKEGRCEGRIPYGSTPQEQQIIHRIKLWRRGRKGGFKGMTLQAIADRLNQEEIPTSLGRKWTPVQVRNILMKK